MKKLPLLSLLLLMTALAYANPVLDSLWNVWQSPSAPDSSRLNAIHSYAWDKYIYTQPESTFYFAQLEYDYAESVGDTIWMSRALNTQGVSMDRLGEYTESIDLHLKSLALKEQLGVPEDIAASLNNLGKVHRKLGEYVETIAYFSQSLEIKEQIGDPNGLFSALLNMGLIYSDQGNNEESLPYYLKSLKIAEELGDQRKLALVQIHLGTYHGQKGEYDEAYQYFEKSLKINEELGDVYSVAGITFNLGFLFSEKGDHQKALDFFRQSLEVRQEIGDREGIAASLSTIGMSHRALGDFPKAISYGNQALAIAQEMGAVRLIKDASEDLFKVYKETGDYQKALSMYELSITMRDSVLKEDNQRALIEQEYKYQYEKQKALDQLENEKQLLVEQAKQQRQQLLSIVIGCGLLLSLIFAWILYRRLVQSKQQAKMIEEQKQRAEQSEKYKEQFLANMSHEIRTPMHAISGMVKILKRNKHLSEQEKFLKAMHVSSDNLTILLDDILDLSKIEAGKIELEQIPFQPAKVLAGVWQLLTYKAEEKGLQLLLNIDPEVPKWVIGDPNRLSQILTNLAGNALKFTEKGSVRIQLTRKDEFLLFEVHDTGIGIPKEKQYSIFEAFEQAEGSTTRNFGGTGLGLNISRQLVELQKGNIWVESEMGLGSTFFVSLPLIFASEDDRQNSHISDEELKNMAHALKGMNILIAEDNTFNQMIVQDDLNYYVPDISFDIVEDGNLAMEKAKSGAYDLILMDVQMPIMDGYEATIGIREWEKEQKKSPIPIIAMTASVLKTEINLCFEAGMDNYIPKPYQIQDLIIKINQAYSKK